MLSRNFIVANYGPGKERTSTGAGLYEQVDAIDTDDGSAYVVARGNFLAYGGYGLKSDFGGHDNKYDSNVLAYVGNCYHTNYMNRYVGYNDAFTNNSCIFRKGYNSDCDVAAGWEVRDNDVYSQSGSLGKICGMNFSSWQKEGHDHGTRVHRWPESSHLISMAHAVLGTS